MLPIISKVNQLHDYRLEIEKLYTAISVEPLGIDQGVVDTVTKLITKIKHGEKMLIKGSGRVLRVGDVDVVIADTASIMNNYMKMYRVYAENVMRISRVIESLIGGDALAYIDPFNGLATILMNINLKSSLTDTGSLSNVVDILSKLNATTIERKAETEVGEYSNIDLTSLMSTLSGMSNSVYVDISDEAYYIVKNYLNARLNNSSH
ncbi:hypothetical protein [Caldivirga sp. MU80]|jgi:hypothetical protein|uniref:hypothetical protein n=1 Tax=Caldivirga sp. MU80 TaxID=1650354 RepID=UPI000830DFDC|nr:hypothetical protein [Caldivirga sp. MU80]